MDLIGADIVPKNTNGFKADFKMLINALPVERVGHAPQLDFAMQRLI